MQQGGYSFIVTFRTATMRTRFLRMASAVLAIIAATALAACGDSKPNAAASGSASTTSAARSSSSAPAGPTYSTQAFTIPLDIALPSFLKPAPDEDSEHFVTFSSIDETKAIRILSPVAVYLPNASTTSPVPSDYVGYLTGLTANGAQITDRVDTKSMAMRPRSSPRAPTRRSTEPSAAQPLIFPPRTASAFSPN